VSYFFCASAPLEDAASTANAAEKTASLLVTTVIPVLPCDEYACHGLSWAKAF
jgi:hypothetical protein